MTFVGKLLVVLQMVLSICFMAFAGAVYTRQQSWKLEYEKADEKVKQVQKEQEETKVKLTALITELNAKAKASDDKAKNLQNEFDLASTQVTSLKADKARLEQEKTTEQALKKSAQDEANIRRDEARLLTQINETLNKELNQKNAIVRTQDDEIFTREIALKNLTEKYDGLLQQVAIFTKVLATNGFSTDPKSYAKINSPTPLVFGRVDDTEPKSKAGRELVQISIGSDDGLTQGTELFVYRVGDRNKFLAKIKLELVKPDQAVGVVIPGTKNGVIEKGDYVSTKL